MCSKQCFSAEKESTHNLKNLGAQATHRRSNYMAKVALGGTNNVPKAKKISRTNVAQLREPTNSGSYPKSDCGRTAPRLIKHFYCFDLRSREPKNTVFQQNPTLVHSQLNAPLDSDAINAAAQSSIHLLGGFFSVCRDLVALRRNPIRSIASRDPICRKS